MDTATSAIFGLLFLTLGFAAVFLMYRIWGYPFDEAEDRSSAPRALVLTHRIVGLCYVALYLFMMSQMVPRLFLYQVEFPVRTIAHVMLGVSIGLLLILKFSILKVFKHFGGALPYIGTAILWCTVMLVSLSVPFALKEVYWSGAATGGNAFSAENLIRVRELLPAAGLAPDTNLDELATESSLRAGRRVLLTRCVTCHDLKTVLTRPRTPSDWVRTVQRMSERQIFGNPIETDEQLVVSTYLIAISPELQSSAKLRREQVQRTQVVRTALHTAMEDQGAGTPRHFDLAEATSLFEATCSQCHDVSEVEEFALGSEDDVRDLLERMVENGLDASEEELQQIGWYLSQVYVR